MQNAQAKSETWGYIRTVQIKGVYIKANSSAWPHCKRGISCVYVCTQPQGGEFPSFRASTKNWIIWKKTFLSYLEWLQIEVQGEDRSSGSEHCPHNTTAHSYVLQICPINKENQAKSAASLVQWNIYPAAAFYWVYGSDLLTSLTISSLCGDTNTASPASRSCTWQAVCVPCLCVISGQTDRECRGIPPCQRSSIVLFRICFKRWASRLPGSVIDVTFTALNFLLSLHLKAFL